MSDWLAVRILPVHWLPSADRRHSGRQQLQMLSPAHAPAVFPETPARTSGPGSCWGSTCAVLGGVACGRDRGFAQTGSCGFGARGAGRKGHAARCSAGSWLSGSLGSTAEPATLTRLLGTVPISHVLPSDHGESGPSPRTPPRSLEDEAEGS